MTTAEDRMWNVRDAILLWLYQEKISGNPAPRPDLGRLATDVGWAAEPIADGDWGQATSYLKSEGYITGSESWGGGVIRPMITSKGENTAAAKKSVRPGSTQPANTTGVTNNYHITNNGPAQVAIGSSDFNQTLTVGSSDDKLTTLAELLDRFAEDNPENADEARSVAEDIREASADSNRPMAALRALMASAISTVAVAAGTEIGQQVTDLAVSVIQS
ncbi:serine recombinase [Nocardia sp. NPDC051463]|uniref:serine recombinase n=1 Tax=Nocardia sp. NPDC051463 TaxID=3154845 RepID=UPI00344BA3FC